MSKYDDLVTKLKEIFQIDRPELDFGVYRILNARAGEINDYLDNRLKAKVADALAKQTEGDNVARIKELTSQIKEEYGKRAFDEHGTLVDADASASEQGKELLRLLQGNQSSQDHENAVFSHLLTFFSRYYDSGDFISQRRYKGDTYAIPYAGEEVVLHWANKDQYYTKSGENFANYSFRLADGRTVHFRLVAADTAKDNRKDNDKERRFVLIEQQTRVVTDEDGDEYEEELLPVEEVDGELVIRFEYRPMPKGTKQDDLVGKAVQAVLSNDAVKSRWLDLAKWEPTDKNPQRTLLEKHLATYTQKNSADYFIHKDLGGFLRLELDFYIKNEVMHLDDVQNAERFADIEKNLRMIQCLRAIALDLIAFLAQLEDFQKKLWLKKKFVVAAHYCITLDRVINDAPELLEEIAGNERQWEQWEKLGMLEAGIARNSEYLKDHPFLMVDTALFDSAFKAKLLGAIDSLDESLAGLLIHGDNYQALNLLQERYLGLVKCVYIDPPYNTGGDGFVYKDSYPHSSWMTMLLERLSSLRSLISNDGLFFSSIDDNEAANLRICLDNFWGRDSFQSQIIVQSNKRGQTYQKIAKTHEYLLAYTVGSNSDIFEITKKMANDALVDDKGYYELWELRNRNPKFGRHNRPNLYYPIFVNPSSTTEDGYAEVSLEKYEDFLEVVPKNSDGDDSCWRWGKEKVAGAITAGQLSVLVAKKRRDGGWNIYEKARKSSTKVKSIWDETSVINEQGTVEVGSLGFSSFGFPKPTSLLEKVLKISTKSTDLAVDFFAGSGTTGHAVINLNRQDNGQRKYILVEQGEYFDTVLKPRIQKVVYSADWKDGKPTAPETGISHAFKVLKIESYEDTLNNLELRRSAGQQSLLDNVSQDAKDDYLLRYMLDIESRGSILSVDSFRRPFDCTLKVAVDSAGAWEERTIDLVETFNYLIGLKVKQIDSLRERGIVMVQGTLPTGEKTLVLWRDCEQVDYDALNRFCDSQDINPRDSEFEVVYINGDHNIPSVLTTTEDEGGITKTLKLRQIEPEFLSRMFDGDA